MIDQAIRAVRPDRRGPRCVKSWKTLAGTRSGRSLGVESTALEGTALAADQASEAPRRARRPGDFFALIGFAVAEAIALPLMLVWGRHGWFTQDDWDFLSARTIGSVHDLFRPHFQHWTTLPILPYRLLWVIVGIRSYTPYQTLIVVAHLIAAALVLVVMRRAGVQPWLATVVAVLFLYFGAGAENILVAFQITFVGAFVFGLVQLLLADHDGALDRRDWFGLLAGFAGLMCSGVAIAMVAVVGIAILVRRGWRGWRVALFHTAPLGIVYLIWLQLAPKGQNAGNYKSHSPVQILRFVGVGVEAAFARLGEIPGVGIVVGLLLVAGLVVAMREPGRRERLRALAVPIALLLGALVFLFATGVERAGNGGLAAFATGRGPERARESRYIYLVAAMTLPALAVAADAIIRRRRVLAIPVVVVLLAGLPGNIHRLATPAQYFANSAATHQEILALPRLPMAGQLRDSHSLVTLQNPRFAFEGLTYGWLVKGVESGSIPAPAPRNKFKDPTDVLEFFLVPTPVRGPGQCASIPNGAIRTLARGQTITIERGRMWVSYVPVGATPSLRKPFGSSTLVALVGPMRLRIVPHDKGAMLCQ
jgi:hypothetical protein